MEVMNVNAGTSDCNQNKNDQKSEDYFKHRSSVVRTWKQQPELSPYPHEFDVSNKIPGLIENYGKSTFDGKVENVSVSVAGRIMSIENVGPKKTVFELHGDGAKIRIEATSEQYSNEDAFVSDSERLCRGDIVGVKGTLNKMENSDLYIIPTEMKLLSPCLHLMPTSAELLSQNDRRYHQRYLDLILNENARNTFITRRKVIDQVRKFLNDRDFLEVETPVMAPIIGGGRAIPFVTHHDQLKQDFFLRISPEIHLKTLLVGGLNRVYEIGPQFRNEEIDSTHNTEFTSCEFYMAYADHNDIMKMCEELISELVKSITGSYKMKCYARTYEDTEPKEYEVDFTPPFRKIKMIPALEEALQMKFPDPIDLDSEASKAFMRKICQERNIPIHEPYTNRSILSLICGYILTHHIIQPTFICDYPKFCSPLSKTDRNEPALSERFELYILSREILNAYTEQNDPFEQRERFEEQKVARLNGDNEAHPYDENFCKALEFGLPPSAGCGLGLDRIIMMLTNLNSIRDVILFPAMNEH